MPQEEDRFLDRLHEQMKKGNFVLLKEVEYQDALKHGGKLLWRVSFFPV